MNRGFGAMPPPEFAWQMGKTAGTIRFVKDAEKLMADPERVLSAKQRDALTERVKFLKEGKEKVTTSEEASVESFLQKIT